MRLLLISCLLSGCAFVERAALENNRRKAEVRYMHAYTDLVVASSMCVMHGEKECTIPPPILSLSHKSGEPDNSLLSLPSLKDMVLP